MEEDKHLPNLLFFGSHILISRVHLSTMGFFSQFQRVCFKPVAHLNCSTLPKDAHQTNSSSFPSRFQKNRSKKTEKYLAAHLPLPPTSLRRMRQTCKNMRIFCNIYNIHWTPSTNDYYHYSILLLVKKHPAKNLILR